MNQVKFFLSQAVFLPRGLAKQSRSTHLILFLCFEDPMTWQLFLSIFNTRGFLLKSPFRQSSIQQIGCHLAHSSSSIPGRVQSGQDYSRAILTNSCCDTCRVPEPSDRHTKAKDTKYLRATCILDCMRQNITSHPYCSPSLGCIFHLYQ